MSFKFISSAAPSFRIFGSAFAPIFFVKSWIPQWSWFILFDFLWCYLTHHFVQHAFARNETYVPKRPINFQVSSWLAGVGRLAGIEHKPWNVFKLIPHEWPWLSKRSVAILMTLFLSILALCHRRTVEYQNPPKIFKAFIFTLISWTWRESKSLFVYLALFLYVTLFQFCFHYLLKVYFCNTMFYFYSALA